MAVVAEAEGARIGRVTMYNFGEIRDYQDLLFDPLVTFGVSFDILASKDQATLRPSLNLRASNASTFGAP